MDTWNTPTVHSRQPVTYKLMESIGPWEAQDDMETADREWKLFTIDFHDRHTWRSGVSPVMCAASQLPRRGPLMWMLPLYLHINQNSGDDVIMFYRNSFP